MSSDTQLIAGLLKAYETHANAGDYKALGEIYADDAILFPDRFNAFEGKEAIAGFYMLAFEMLILSIEFDIDTDKIMVAGSTAYATTTSAGTRYLRETDQTLPEINRELWVFQKLDGTWKIARYCFNKSE
ncbi:MAG: DUF4440 domain-containing protein [Pseudomonadota bacterium]